MKKLKPIFHEIIRNYEDIAGKELPRIVQHFGDKILLTLSVLTGNHKTLVTLISLLDQHKGPQNVSDIENMLKLLNGGYKVEGVVPTVNHDEPGKIFVVNHPRGIIDGFQVCDAIYQQNKNPKILVVSDSFLQIIHSNLTFNIPVYKGKKRKTYEGGLGNIHEKIKEGYSLVIFPAGEVSYMTDKGKVVDPTRKTFAFGLANANDIPIVPVYINAAYCDKYYKILYPGQNAQKKNKPGLQGVIQKIRKQITMLSYAFDTENTSEPVICFRNEIFPKHRRYSIPSDLKVADYKKFGTKLIRSRTYGEQFEDKI